jgi:hypothetical protein
MPITVSGYTGSNNVFKLDLPQVRIRILNIGLYSVFSYSSARDNNGSFITENKLDYLFPVGIQIPVKQNKNMQWSIGSNFYWTRSPYIIEAEFRMDYRFFSVMTGYRYMDYNPNPENIFYAGLSIGYHHFYNRRKVSPHKKMEIQNAIGYYDSENIYNLDFTKDDYLDISSNLREGIDYNSTLTFLEDGHQNSVFMDSLCVSRSVDILKIVKSKTEINDISGIKVSIYYGGFAPEVRYDNGTSGIQRMPNQGAYPNIENTYNGSSKTFYVLSPLFIYSLKINLEDFSSLEDGDEPGDILKKCAVDNKIQNYLENNTSPKK